MTASPRWYLSATAVREYAAAAGLHLDDGGPQWAAAEKELAGHCDAARLVSQDGARQLWRTGNRRTAAGRLLGRLEFTVSTAPRPEGPLPQLVRTRLKGHANNR